MKKERLTPVAGQLYTHNRRNAFQSRSYYTVKFTRFTDGRSAWCFLMLNATRIRYDGKDKEFPRKSFTCEPFFCFFLIFCVQSYGFSCETAWRQLVHLLVQIGSRGDLVCFLSLEHGCRGWNGFFITSIFINTSTISVNYLRTSSFGQINRIKQILFR